MPGKSQYHTDAVLNVLRGSALAGVTPYVGLFSVAPEARREGADREVRSIPFRHDGGSGRCLRNRGA